jgi:hypothetical protein
MDPLKDTLANAEAQTEKAGDHLSASFADQAIRVLDAFWQSVWKTRITIDLSKRE